MQIYYLKMWSFYIYTHTHIKMASLVAQPAIQETWVRSLGREDALEKGTATHWRIPWTEEPGGLQSTGSQRVGHD